MCLQAALFSCTGQPPPGKKETPRVSDKQQDQKHEKELLIYCGITMIRPMTQIAQLIESQEACKITITKGGSGNLLRSIVHNRTGDLYLPGSERYYQTINENYPGLVTKTQFVGHNRAALMVQKANPHQFKSDLSVLVDRRFGVVIGNPDSGSIGRETKRILEKKGIFEAVVKNALFLTTDSKDLVKAIRSREADIVINWYAVSTWDDNPRIMDVIDIAPEYAQTKQLILGLLKYCRHPDIAEKFMQFAGSPKGRHLFRINGLYFD